MQDPLLRFYITLVSWGDPHVQLVVKYYCALYCSVN